MNDSENTVRHIPQSRSTAGLGGCMQRFALERPKKIHKGEFPWSSCAPFVENSRGTLIHRPRTGSTYNIHRTGPHVGIGFWCGMHVSSGGNNLTFLAAPPDGGILCERCEAAALANGLPSADELAGRHVHKGRTVAVATCCDLTPNAKSEPTSGMAAKVGSTDGLCIAVPPEPTFTKEQNDTRRTN